MGIKLSWFRARMNVKNSVPANRQLIGTYSYKFESYYDSSENSKPSALANTEDKSSKQNDDKSSKPAPLVKSIQHSTSTNLNNSTEKQKVKDVSNNKKNAQENMKETLLEVDDNKSLNLTEANNTHTNERLVTEYNTASETQGGNASLIQTYTNQLNEDFIKNRTMTITEPIQEILSQDIDKTIHAPKMDSEIRENNEAIIENRVNTNSDHENCVIPRNDLQLHSTDGGEKRTLRSRRLPEGELGELKIIIPDSSDDEDIYGDDEDYEDEYEHISSAFDEFQKYDEFDS